MNLPRGRALGIARGLKNEESDSDPARRSQERISTTLRRPSRRGGRRRSLIVPGGHLVRSAIGSRTALPKRQRRLRVRPLPRVLDLSPMQRCPLATICLQARRGWSWRSVAIRSSARRGSLVCLRRWCTTRPRYRPWALCRRPQRGRCPWVWGRTGSPRPCRSSALPARRLNTTLLRCRHWPPCRPRAPGRYSPRQTGRGMNLIAQPVPFHRSASGA